MCESWNHLELKFSKSTKHRLMHRRSCDMTSISLFKLTLLLRRRRFYHGGKLVHGDIREYLRDDCLPNGWMEFNIQSLPTSHIL